MFYHFLLVNIILPTISILNLINCYYLFSNCTFLKTLTLSLSLSFFEPHTHTLSQSHSLSLTHIRQPLTVSILSERRSFQPYGMNGGDPGSRGVNTLTLGKDKRTISLGGKNTVNVVPGDVLTILTPGGGGFGTPLTTTTKTTTVPDDRSRSGNNHGNRDVKVENSNTVHVKSGGSLNQYTLNQESV